MRERKAFKCPICRQRIVTFHLKPGEPALCRNSECGAIVAVPEFSGGEAVLHADNKVLKTKL